MWISEGNTYVCALQFDEYVVAIDLREESTKELDDVLQCGDYCAGDGPRGFADAIGSARPDRIGDLGDDANQAADHAVDQLGNGQQQCDDQFADAAQLFKLRAIRDRIYAESNRLDLAREVSQFGADFGQQCGSGGGDCAHNERQYRQELGDESLQ